METTFASSLEPWLERRAPEWLAVRVGWGRFLAVHAVGSTKAHEARRTAGAALVCVGNLWARPETLHHGVRGCRRVYHGPWRLARVLNSDASVPVGPRCDSCRKRITDDRRKLVDGFTRNLS